MPRLLGVDIPANKKVAYSLRYINGIGPARADIIVKEAKIEHQANTFPAILLYEITNRISIQ